jgi:hypothetical protein
MTLQVTSRSLFCRGLDLSGFQADGRVYSSPKCRVRWFQGKSEWRGHQLVECIIRGHCLLMHARVHAEMSLGAIERGEQESGLEGLDSISDIYIQRITAYDLWDGPSDIYIGDVTGSWGSRAEARR